ncbi:predicted protein [Lichtheimia corymbifera JMRC:FSU:9682]|uniref:WWE domain-containing protein n=1 Tax=Lichtheimia corymbifera JMRC:FSU:9682 TaxID=1263082 RepID=A0A068RXZ0_9FUNG|nr:predicted protein [Lichtheimia corymbifera JMRC:FSU:9682]
MASTTRTTVSYRWLYQAGNQWVPFDPTSNVKIEDIWRSNRPYTFYIPCLGGDATIHPSELYMERQGIRIPIIRSGA